MIISDLPTGCKKPLRVLGIDLGTTNSVITEIKWHPGSNPETKVIQIEQDTPLGRFTDILFPSVVAIQAGKVWVGEGANRMKRNPQEYKLIPGKNLFSETKLDMGIGRTYANAPDGFRSASEIAGHIINSMIQHAISMDASPMPCVAHEGLCRCLLHTTRGFATLRILAMIGVAPLGLFGLVNFSFINYPRH